MFIAKKERTIKKKDFKMYSDRWLYGGELEANPHSLYLTTHKVNCFGRKFRWYKYK